MSAELILRTRQANGVTMSGSAMRAQLPILAAQGIKRKPRIVYYGPTGFGKSIVFADMARKAAARGLRVCVMLDRIVLVNQTSAVFDDYRIPHAVIMSESGRFHLAEKIHICSVHTLASMDMMQYDLILIDECHVLYASQIRICEANENALIVGFTATPTTKSCGLFFDDIVCPATTNELVNEGLLIMPAVYCAEEIDMSGVKSKNGEWDKEESGKRTIKIIGNIVGDYLEKTNAHFGGPVKAVVAVPNVASGAELAQAFAAVGLNFIPISYRDDKDFKRDVFKDFARDDTKIHGLIAVDILTKGFDNPGVKFGICARAWRKGFEQFVQFFGRIMRICEGKSEAVFNDHGGNFFRFGQRLDDQFLNGCTTLNKGDQPKAPKEKTKAEKAECVCPKCRALWVGNSDACKCGYVRPPRKSGVETVAGKMKKRQSKALEAISRKQRQEFYSGLLSIQETKKYKETFAIAAYKEKFGDWPNDCKKIAAEPQKEVLSWVRSRMIKHAKSAHKKEAA